MRCELRVVSGARSGVNATFEKSYISIGRHPLSDLKFDPELDLDASARHAAVLRSGDGYVVRDLGSTNGTYVNGEKIDADRELHEGDRVRFGANGPEIEFRLVADASAEKVMRAVPPPAAPPREPSKAPPVRTPRPTSTSKPSATSVLRAELSVQRSKIRSLLIFAVVVVGGALGVVIWQGRESRETAAELGQRVESLTREVAQLRQLQAQTDSQASSLRSRLASERDPARRETLRAELATTEIRSQNIAQAAAVDWRSVAAQNRAAVAIVYVRFSDTTQMWTGTAFTVTAAGVMLTNRHLVLNSRGERARDIAIQFSGSDDVHPARIERVAADADIAVLRLESAGPFPVVAGISSATPEAGDPIGLLGFPLGFDLPQGSSPTASLFTGSVSRVIPDSLIQLDAWSGTGASGSPIFDRHGRVIGVEFGGIRESGGRVILGLPIARAMALVRR